ncbi:hypothetical protein HYC85_027985 [Camellia sinensis]|uniref:DNA-directed RNA polymerase I subunit rpa49 n=1 Tax=Camellia sinensis TaxID=4442 RepID=A0A7J7FXX2_CAMSI|nr:hypothetical protein HYC85_027985 [Camellia sinensis]
MKKKKENIHVKKIETFSEHPDKIAPLVGYFPSGFDPLKEESSTQEQPKVRVFRHENRTKRLQLVVSPNGSQVNFVGTNYSGEATAPQLCNYALGVLDKESQTLKIVPIASNKHPRKPPTEQPNYPKSGSSLLQQCRSINKAGDNNRRIRRRRRRREQEEKKKKMKKKKENIHVKMLGTFIEHPDKDHPSTSVTFLLDSILSKKNYRHRRNPRHENRTKRLQLLVSPNGSQVNFVSTNYSGEAMAPQLCNYALGVLDKESQTLNIAPIVSNKIFRLEPIVAGSDSYEKEPSKEELRAEERADKIRELKRMYSTAKSVKQDKKRRTLYRKENPETQEELDRKIEGIKINKEALESVGSHNARNVPPHDTSATTPQMAYPVDMIIFAGEWDYLGDILELLHVGAEVAPNVYPSFVYNRLRKLERIKDEVERTTLACVFSYITHLIKFKDKHSSEGSSSAKHHKIPSILVQKFSTMFANSDSKWLTDEKKDLLISYVLVLTLIADGFQTYPSDIAKDLRMTTMNVRQHYQNLGCKFLRTGNSSVATLPVPLQFPKLVQKRRR